jgi:N-acetylneuraminate lyase
MTDIKGIITAPYTPLLDNGEINLDYVETYYNYLKKNGISGAFINGSTGDFPSLTTEERNQFTAKWCEVADDDFLTMIHVGHTSLKECQNMSEHAGNCSDKS